MTQPPLHMEQTQQTQQPTETFDQGLAAYQRGDHTEAFHIFKPRAEQGDPIAQYNLGFMYAHGIGTDQNHKQAALWYQKAAEQGDAISQFNLGLIYANGKGIPKDNKQAAFWLEKAAKQGNINDWFKESAEQGDAAAQYNLGLMYDEGKGVPEDDIQAYAWYNLAASQGHKKAEENRNLLRQEMTPTQIAEAQKLSRQLQAKIDTTNSTDDTSSSFPSPSIEATPPTNEAIETASIGSGFIIGNNGEILTNHHVIEDCFTVSIRLNNTLYPAQIIATDEHNDLALLKISKLKNQTAATFSNESHARLGQTITAAGYPLGGLLSSGLHVTGGNISALAGIDDHANHLQITAPIQPGNSGGPILDQAGNLIGVTVSSLRDDAIGRGDIPQNVNFAIKAPVARAFLDRHGIRYHRRTFKTKLTTEQLAQTAQQFTVAIHCR